MSQTLDVDKGIRPSFIGFSGNGGFICTGGGFSDDGVPTHPGYVPPSDEFSNWRSRWKKSNIDQMVKFNIWS